MFYLFNSRFLRESSLSFARLFTNRAVWIAVGVLVVLQLVFVYAPFMHKLFGSTPLGLRHWLVPLGIGLAVFLIVEAEKAIFRRIESGKKPPPPSRQDGSMAKTTASQENPKPPGRMKEYFNNATPFSKRLWISGRATRRTW